MKKIFLLLMPIIISCTQNISSSKTSPNINSKDTNNSRITPDINSENKVNSSTTSENPEKELIKVQIIKHDELNYELV